MRQENKKLDYVVCKCDDDHDGYHDDQNYGFDLFVDDKYLKKDSIVTKTEWRNLPKKLPPLPAQCAVERNFVGIITLDHCSLQDIAGKCLRSESWAVTKEKCILHLEIGQRSNSNWGKIGRKFCGWNQPLKLGRNLAKKTGQRGMTCDSLPHKCNTRCWILAVRVDSGNWGLDGCTFSRGVSSSPVLNLSTHPAFFSRKHTLRFCWQ